MTHLQQIDAEPGKSQPIHHTQKPIGQTLRQNLAKVQSCEARPSGNYASTLDALIQSAAIASDWHAALAAGRDRVGVLRAAEACDAKRRPELVQALGNISWSALFAHDWATAQSAAEEALGLDPTQIWIETNAIHARMLTGDVDAARARYLANWGKEIPEHGTWEATVLDDFKQLRAAGIESPLMAEIEVAFTKREVGQPAPVQP